MNRTYKIDEQTARDRVNVEHRFEIFKKQDYYILHLDGVFYSTGECIAEILDEIHDIKRRLSA